MRSKWFVTKAAALFAAALFTCACSKDAATAQAEAEKKLAEAQAQLEQAQKAVEAAKQQTDAERRVADAQAQLEQAKKALDTAQKQAANTTASAPSSTAAPVPPPPPEPKVYTLPAGSTVAVRTTTALSTKTAKTGDAFVATLHQPLVVDGYVIADKGATVQGVVADSDPGGRVKGVASIAVALRSVTTPSGEVLELPTSQVGAQARTTKKKDAVKVGIASGVGAAIGAIAGGGKGAAIGAGAGAAGGTGVVMATRGEPAVIASESVLSFRTSAPVSVTVKQ